MVEPYNNSSYGKHNFEEIGTHNKPSNVERYILLQIAYMNLVNLNVPYFGFLEFDHTKLLEILETMSKEQIEAEMASLLKN